MILNTLSGLQLKVQQDRCVLSVQRLTDGLKTSLPLPSGTSLFAYKTDTESMILLMSEFGFQIARFPVPFIQLTLHIAADQLKIGNR